MRAGPLRSSVPLHHSTGFKFLSCLLTSSILCGYWTYPSLFALPLYLSFVPYRWNWDVQRKSWIEELRTGMFHSSFLSEKKGRGNSFWNEWSNSYLSELLFQLAHMSEVIFMPVLYSHSFQYIWLWRIYHFTPFWKVFCLKVSFL